VNETLTLLQHHFLLLTEYRIVSLYYWGCVYKLMAEISETSLELVRYSRAGDVFHYRWAARRCLQLIYPNTNLQRFFVEGSLERHRAGEYVIDVSEYSCHNSEEQVTYFQLKHSTTRIDQPFQLSDLKDTIEGFAKRFRDLKRNAIGIRKVKFSLITNRPVAVGFKDGIRAIATRQLVKQNFQKTLEKYSGLKTKRLREFCSALDLIDGEGNYSVQRDKLHAEVALLTADLHDPFEVDKFVTLVQEKVMPGNDGEIKKEEILQRFGVTSERELLPAPCEIQESPNLFQREQHDELLRTIVTASSPLIIHASGGVGKSVVALQLSQSLPIGSVGILYDCFGSGKYRNRTEPRHQHRVACLQIANELAAKGLCEPLIAGSRADSLMRSLLQRMKAAAMALRRVQPDAVLVVFIDAADNAEMAATEFSESCFANELLREGIPEGCRIVALCRTERIQLLKPQSYVGQIELRVFSESESLRHLRTRFPKATDFEGQEYHRLSSKNPRVQANALDIHIKDTTVSSVLYSLGPSATTVDQQIEAQLESAVASVKDRLSKNYQDQIETICQGLANLPPFIPIDVLARAADVDRSVISSFASDLGRPLYLSENSVHFRDEPTETWFRQRFAVSASDIKKYADRLKPLAAEIPYVASVLPALLLQSGQYDELIHLALSDESLPKNSPIDERNIRVYRLQFALKAALQRKRYADAAKLALRAGEETAGEQRQLNLLTNNLDLIAPLQSSERVQELAFRRMLRGGWAGSENVYSAALLSFVEEFKGDSRSFRRSGREWLSLYFDEREQQKKENQYAQDALEIRDIGEMATTVLNLDGIEAVVGFISSWSPPRTVFDIATFLVRRLVDKGDFKTVDMIAQVGSGVPNIILAISSELASVGRYPPTSALRNSLTMLHKDQTLISIPEHEELDNRKASIQSALLAFAESCGASRLNKKHIIQILDTRFSKRVKPYIVSPHLFGDLDAFLRFVALKTALERDGQADLKQWFPAEWLEEKLGYEQKQKKEEFEQVFAYLFPWYLARVQIMLGNSETLEAIFQNAEAQSGKSTRSWFQGKEQFAFEVSRIRFECLFFHKTSLAETKSFASSLLEGKYCLKFSDKLKAVRIANRLEHLKEIRAPIEQACSHILKHTSDETPEELASGYIQLARAVLATDHADAASYFDLAIEAVSKFGDEVVDRWGALTAMAERTCEATQGSPELAYRYIRCAELVGDSVIREKHWDRTETVEVCFRLNPASGFTALSRWRDRYVGNLERLLPALASVALDSGQILPSVGWALSAFSWEHSYIEFAVMCIEREPNQVHQQFILDSAVRDLRLQDRLGEWQKLKDVAQKFSLNANKVQEVLDFQANQHVIVKGSHITPNNSGSANEPEETDWSALLDDLSLVSSDGLGKALQRFQSTPYPHWHEKLWQQIFSRIPDKNAKQVLEQLFLVEGLDFHELKTAIQQFPDRFKQKVSVQRYWSDFIRQIAKRFAAGLCNRWTRKSFLDILGSETNHIQLIREGIAEGLATSNDLSEAGTLFGFCEVIAGYVSPQEAREVLEFALERFELHMNEGNADGAWAAWLEPPANIQEALTGFLWSALGSPRSSERWMAAHSVRRLAETGCQLEIDLLVAWMTRDTVGAFIGRTFPFYKLHARLYLLIALARVAIDHPALLRQHADVFEHHALKGEPHALIQKYAAQIALSIEASFPATYATNTVAMLQTVGISQFPRKKNKGHKKRIVQTPWHVRDEVNLTVKNYLSYDFDRWFSAVADVFGVQENQVEELAQDVIFQRWQVQTTNKSIIDPREWLWKQANSERATFHSHGDYPRTDDYSFYLCYHALLQIAAMMLSEMPVVYMDYEDDDGENAWNTWLTRHDLTRTDGRWLADRRDPAPLQRPSWLSTVMKDTWRDEVGMDESHFLEALLMSHNANTWLYVDGYWDEGDRERNEHFNVSSALVAPSTSQALLNALSTCIDPADFKLPDFDEERMEFDVSPFELHGWTWRSYTSNQLDEFDPHAGEIDYPPFLIDDDLVDRLELVADLEKRKWVSKKDGIESLISELWGEYKVGSDFDTSKRKGSRMFASLGFLKTLCKTMNRDLIFKVQVERTFRESSNYRRNDKNGYRPPTCKVFLFSADGRLRTTTTSYQLR
jgi:hypothetical protein